MADLRAQLAAGMAVAVAARDQAFVDACTATRPGAQSQTPPIDPETGLRQPVAASTVYDGPCALSNPASAQRAGTTTTNDESGVPNSRVLKGPAGMVLRPGDLVKVTASTFQPGLVGDTFVVLGEVERTFGTHRRYQVRGNSWASPANPTSPAPGT